MFKIRCYISKVDYLYQEYTKDKENNEDFVNKVISYNNQINETFNSCLTIII